MNKDKIMNSSKLKSFLVVFLLGVFSLSASAHEFPKVALVLGGGGAKGAAECGALKVIEKSGVPIDYIVGTSIGSIVGGLYSMGYRADDIERMFNSQEWVSLLTDRDDARSRKFFSRDSIGVSYILGFPVHRRHTVVADTLPGIFKGAKVMALLDSMVRISPVARREAGVRRIPFRCVAVDVAHGEFREVVLNPDSVRLDSCMRASMAIPGVFKPMRIGENVLIDGGAMNNLPVDVARKMGADIVIAIDLQQNKHDDYKSPLSFIKGSSGVASWLKNRPDIAKYNEMRRSADIYVNPDLGKYDVMSFSSKAIQTMIDLGDKAMEKHYHDLVKLAKKLKTKIGKCHMK